MISICGVVATICHNHLRRWWIGRKRFAIRQSPRPDLCVMVANILVFRQSAKQRVSALYCSLFAEELDWRPLSSSPSPPTQHHCHHGIQAALVAQERNISQLLKLAHPNVIWAMDPKVSLTWRARSLGAEFSSHSLILTMSGKILGEKNIYLLCQD